MENEEIPYPGRNDQLKVNLLLTNCILIKASSNQYISWRSITGILLRGFKGPDDAPI
jgi:hypothetical protein